MIFSKRFAAPGQIRQITIERNLDSGWIAKEQTDGVVRTSLLRDWRHVEATIALFELKASALRDEGWAESAAGA
jgi:hypothetical protein